MDLIPDWVMLHDKLWLTLAAWLGIAVYAAIVALLVAALFGLRTPSLRHRRWFPAVLLARLRARNARILDERERRANR